MIVVRKKPPSIHMRLFSDIASMPSLPVWNHESKITVVMDSRLITAEAIHVICALLSYRVHDEINLLVYGNR